MGNYFSTISTPCFYIILASGDFSLEYATLLATLINLNNKD